MKTNTILLLRPQDVKDVISMKQAIDLVEQGYREASAFPLINAPRRRVHSKASVRVSTFPGGIDGLKVIGSLTRAEQVAQAGENQNLLYREHPVYVLWDSESARLECILAGEITEQRIGFSSVMALRTAATSGVGFRYLARKNSRIAGVYGTGGQALHKVMALQNERPIETYKVFSRNPVNREKFCQRVTALIDAEMFPVEHPREVIEGADVVICATNSNVPVFDGNWLEPGQHLVTVVGSNDALVKGGWLKSGRRENDDITVQRSDIIVTNWRESVKQDRQAGLVEPIEKGIISWDKIQELGDIISGKTAGRTDDQQITYHANNNGTAAADLAIAKWVFQECKRMGRGIPIELPFPGEQ